jgi:hypothetical protein
MTVFPHVSYEPLGVEVPIPCDSILSPIVPFQDARSHQGLMYTHCFIGSGFINLLLGFGFIEAGLRGFGTSLVSGRNVCRS